MFKSYLENKNNDIFYVIFLLSHLLYAGNPISIDGLFEDWDEVDIAYSDQQNDGSNADYSHMKITYDNQFLFIYFKFFDGEFLMQNWNEFHLYIDADDDSETGKSIYSMGVDLEWSFGDRSGMKYLNGEQYEVYQNNISLRIAPTVTSSEFEIGISRSSLPLTLNNTQTLTDFKLLLFESGDGGDFMPSELGGLSYTIGEGHVVDPEPITLERLNGSDIRLVSYNTWNNGIINMDRQHHFKRILQAIDPDIIAFQEHSDWEYVHDIIQSWFPDEDWHASWTYNDLVILSRFWIINDAHMGSGRTMAALLDTENELGGNLLIFNSHLSCCDNNEDRQQQVDQFAGEWREWVVNGSGPFEIDNGVPFIHVGDFNFVGYRKQVETMRLGDIEDEGQYGIDFPPDWDGSSIVTLFPRHTHKRMGYTWRNDASSFNPGKLDYIFYSDLAINHSKHYVLNTLAIDEASLDFNGMQWDDTREASDHLPVVFDITIQDNVGIEDYDFLPAEFALFQNYPNPFNNYTEIIFKLYKSADISLKIFDVNGREIKRVFFGYKEKGGYNLKWAGNNNFGHQVVSGIYFVLLENKNFSSSQKIILLK